MQEQDAVSIEYFEDPARMADLVNGYIYHGQEIVKPENVRVVERSIARIGRRKQRAASGTGGQAADKMSGQGEPSTTKTGGQEKQTVAQTSRQKKEIYAQVVTADIVREVSHGMRVAMIAVESQTDIHYAMPIRVMNLESTNYHKQWRKTANKHRQAKDLTGAEFLSGFSKEDKLIPTITIVVYFGKEPWDGPTSLKEMMELEEYPPELRDLVVDYPIHLLEVRKYQNLEDFHTDIQYVFGFLQNEDSKEGLKEYVHTHEQAFSDMSEDAYELISVMSHSQQLEEYKVESREEGGRNMCRAIEEMIEEGRQDGLIQGFIEACRELGISKEDTLARLKEKFGIKEEAEVSLTKYWC